MVSLPFTEVQAEVGFLMDCFMRAEDFCAILVTTALYPAAHLLILIERSKVLLVLLNLFLRLPGFE